jgi:hypothetical protein
MSKFILTTAIVAAIGLPSIGIAQNAPITGSIVCRPVKAGETANANIQDTQLMCHPLNLGRLRDAMVAAQTNMSADQKAKMKVAMAVLRDELLLEPTYPGFDGNPND